MTSKRSFKFNLTEKGSEDLKKLANELGITETEVLRKGLTLMSLYAKLKKDNRSGFFLKEGDDMQELLIL